MYKRKKMWKSILAMMIFGAASFTMVRAGGELERGQAIFSEKEARKIAEESFLEVTNGRISKYVITPLEQEDNCWSYFVGGQEEFARPGYSWIVKVNKRTGAPEILKGE